MPLLDKDSLEELNTRPIRICEKCSRPVRWNYCRQCDEFFEAGHLGGQPDCNPEHDSHRTY